MPYVLVKEPKQLLVKYTGKEEGKLRFAITTTNAPNTLYGYALVKGSCVEQYLPNEVCDSGDLYEELVNLAKEIESEEEE